MIFFIGKFLLFLVAIVYHRKYALSMIKYAVLLTIFPQNPGQILCIVQMGIAIRGKIVYSFCELIGKQMIIWMLLFFRPLCMWI